MRARERGGRGTGRDLLLVLLELGEGGLLEGHGEGRDGVVVRPALQAREDGLVDGVLEIVLDLVALGVLRRRSPPHAGASGSGTTAAWSVPARASPCCGAARRGFAVRAATPLVTQAPGSREPPCRAGWREGKRSPPAEACAEQDARHRRRGRLSCRRTELGSRHGEEARGRGQGRRKRAIGNGGEGRGRGPCPWCPCGRRSWRRAGRGGTCGWWW